MQYLSKYESILHLHLCQTIDVQSSLMLSNFSSTDQGETELFFFPRPLSDRPKSLENIWSCNSQVLLRLEVINSANYYSFLNPLHYIKRWIKGINSLLSISTIQKQASLSTLNCKIELLPRRTYIYFSISSITWTSWLYYFIGGRPEELGIGNGNIFHLGISSLIIKCPHESRYGLAGKSYAAEYKNRQGSQEFWKPAKSGMQGFLRLYPCLPL